MLPTMLPASHTATDVRAAMLLLLMTLSLGAAAMEEYSQPFFAEPTTGKKVSSYSIALSVSRDEQREFSIPQQCPEAIDAIRRGAAYKGSVLERRLWMKIEADCGYYQLLQLHPRRGLDDYVSDYDFANSALDILPYELVCASVEDDGETVRCIPSITDTYGRKREFPLMAASSDLAQGQDETACRLKNGVFHGRVYVDAEGLRCTRDDRATLRLVGVDYADVNGDRVLDAVLRFVPIAPEFGRRPFTLPVTRFAPCGPFRVPEQPLLPRAD